MQHPSWPLLVQEVEHDLEGWRRRLMSGSFQTIEEGKMLAGRVQGAERILTLPERLDRQIVELRDQIEQQKALDA